jgi:hypothetical protein
VGAAFSFFAVCGHAQAASGKRVRSAFYDTAKLKVNRKVIARSRNRTAHLLAVGLVGCNGCIIALMAFKLCRLIVEQTGLCFFPEVHSVRGIVVSERNHRNGSDTRRPFYTGLPGTNPYARRPATTHMQSHLPRNANAIAYTSMPCHPAFSDPGLVSDVQ